MMKNTYKGKTLSFHDLVKTQKVEIPIIQRDYAQGRKDKKEIRLNFLNALFECIDSNKPIKLDFIYGSNVNHSFQPLDGQQRLTTLFLLHWYAATKDKSITKNENKELLSRFSYETRITSRDFCFALVNNTIDIINENENLSSKIIDSNWFFLSWRNDPTIDSMLRTIDDIHDIFFNIEQLWDKITSPLNLISFYYVELENIGLTDDLYIKMNARGKLLTSFENFKASFQKHIEDVEWEKKQSFNESFAFKIDTTWTDYFWHHFRKNNTIDNALMRFIATIAMIRQAIERTITKADERVSLITKLQDEPNAVRPEHFTKASFDYLIQCFELYLLADKSNLNLALPFPMWRHKTKNSILSEVVYDDNVFSSQINSATYTQKVLFFAQTEYLRKVENFDSSKFEDWMRVIRNIVSRGDIDKDGNRPDIIRSPQTFDGVINLISELSDGCLDIYNHLKILGSLKSQFAKDQIEEEKNKAKLITINEEYKKLIFEAEDNELLRGKIDFLLYTMNYNYSVDNFNLELFRKLTNVFSRYFNTEDGLNNDLRRAMLTIDVKGNFEFYNYWWSYWHIVGATKRRLFDKFRELEYYIYSDYKEYFKKLVLLLIEKDLKKITSDFTPDIFFPNWKRRLIQEPELFNNKVKSNYIAILEDNSCCYLLKSKRPRDIDGSEKIE